MGQTPSFCGVILAADESSLLGYDPALLPWPPLTAGAVLSGTFLSTAIQIFSPRVDLVLVVAGKNVAALTPVIYANGASLAINPDPSGGQFSSLRIGLQEVLSRGRDAAMVTLVNRPPARAETIDKLVAAFEQAKIKRKWAVIPEYQETHGYPIILGREMMEAFLKAPATSNAQNIERTHQNEIEYVPVNDPLVAMQVDTPEQYASITPQLPPST
jgi:molybdenum cofactor cytidylyltransferase